MHHAHILINHNIGRVTRPLQLHAVASLHVDVGVPRATPFFASPLQLLLQTQSLRGPEDISKTEDVIFPCDLEMLNYVSSRSVLGVQTGGASRAA